MNPERYMVTALPVDGGERVTGFYTQHRVTAADRLKDLVYAPDKHPSGWYSQEIDPATIEPVRLPVRFEPPTGCPDALYCPNCGYDLMGGMETDTEHDPPYCWECGQALGWPKRTAEGGPKP